MGRDWRLLLARREDAPMACLAACAWLLGDHADLLRWGSRLGGTTATPTPQAIIAWAEAVGLGGRLVRCSPETIFEVQSPAILQVRDGYAVLGGIRPDRRFRVFFPMSGWKTMSLDVLASQIGGAAIEISRTNKFVPAGRSSLRLRDLLVITPSVNKATLQIAMLSLVVQAYAMVGPLFLQVLVDQAISLGQSRVLFTVAGCFGALAIFNSGATTLRNLALQRLGALLGWGMGRTVFHHLFRLPFSWFQTRRLSDVMSRAQSVDQFRTFLSSLVSGSLIDGALSVTTCIAMLIISPSLALVALGALIVFLSIRLLSIPVTMHFASLTIEASALEQGSRIENIRFMQLIKLMAAEASRESDWSAKLSAAIAAAQRASIASTLFSAAQDLVVALTGIVVAALGAARVIDGAMTLGVLLAFLAYQTQFMQRASSLLENFISWRNLSLHKARLGDIMLVPPENGLDSVIAPLATSGKLAVNSVSFTYPGAERPTLKDLNLVVEPGEFVAITGASGAGKSTLLRLLAGLLEPDVGEVLLDGMPYQTWGVGNIRRHMSVVMQDDDLLAGSIAENVAFFSPNIDHQRVLEALEMAEILDHVRTLPFGVNTLMGDLSAPLSSGQRQRLTIARALYRQPRVLILDEGTSHLDLETEKRVWRRLAGLSITRLIVTHRPETMQQADRLLHLDSGSLKPSAR